MLDNNSTVKNQIKNKNHLLVEGFNDKTYLLQACLPYIKSQYVVSSKIVKSLENTDFYELRISISSNEYRTILLAIDHDNFMQSKNILLLNSFLKKDTKQYKAEIKKAENIVKRYLED